MAHCHLGNSAAHPATGWHSHRSSERRRGETIGQKRRLPWHKGWRAAPGRPLAKQTEGYLGFFFLFFSLHFIVSNDATCLKQWGQPDGCFPKGTESLSGRDSWRKRAERGGGGIQRHYLQSGRKITFKSPAGEYSWRHYHFGWLGI